MCRVGLFERKPCVESMLWLRKTCGDVEPERDESRPADGDEERLNRFAALREIGQPALDELAAGKIEKCGRHRRERTATVATLRHTS